MKGKEEEEKTPADAFGSFVRLGRKGRVRLAAIKEKGKLEGVTRFEKGENFPIHRTCDERTPQTGLRGGKERKSGPGIHCRGFGRGSSLVFY